MVHDALAMDSVPNDRYDVICCLQTVHHFPAGDLALLMSNAYRNTTHSVIFIDVFRSLLTIGTVAPLTLLLDRFWPFTCDFILSVRKMYHPEELELLGWLGLAGERCRARFLSPGYTVFEAFKDKGKSRGKRDRAKHP